MNKYKISVIIAIFNNGKLLRDRCIEGLKKSSIFKDMEILLIDDGSTDDETLYIVKGLEREYENIKAAYLPKGGSGGACRPRNIGIHLSTCDYITYLDPDNEAINDGYYKLYKQLEKDDFDIVLGNYKIIDDHNSRLANYYDVCKKRNFDCNNIKETKNVLLKTNFNVDSIQAALIKKSLIIENNIIMEGVGEDTVFFYEIMLYAKKVSIINETIHLYYKNREDSLTNSINNRYFDGHLITQKRKKRLFEQFSILEEYLNLKQEYHFKHYLYNKMFQAKDVNYAKNKLYEIYEVYEDKWNVKDKELREFFIEGRLK